MWNNIAQLFSGVGSGSYFFMKKSFFFYSSHRDFKKVFVKALYAMMQANQNHNITYIHYITF